MALSIIATKNKDIAAADVWSKVTTKTSDKTARELQYIGNLCGVSVAVNLKKESE